MLFENNQVWHENTVRRDYCSFDCYHLNELTCAATFPTKKQIIQNRNFILYNSPFPIFRSFLTTSTIFKSDALYQATVNVLHLLYIHLPYQNNLVQTKQMFRF
jgi:hypothetical protein